MSKYTPIIGLEVHVELKTNSKMFCSCSADYFGKEPNTHTCPVCLGLPGALPVPNQQAIEWCIMIAQALGCEINRFSKFDRKNYFYPDLAKGYQISQYDLPFGKKGEIKLKSNKTIGITRVHMEEDTGKLMHLTQDQKSKIKNQNGVGSLIDFNRSGVPLVEIVTEPDFHDAKDVVEYLQTVRQIVRYLDVSNADMEKGEMRLEPNISLARSGEQVAGSKNHTPSATRHLPSYKVEVKNINSFRFVEKAINYELQRQEELLEKGQTPPQETRGWSESQNGTFSQRLKEEANDYRYFPEPDIPPITFTGEQISTLRGRVPELQVEKIARFVKEFGLSEYDAEILTRERTSAANFEDLVIAGKDKAITPKQIANYLINKKIDLEVFVSDSTKLSEIVSIIALENKKDEISEEELSPIIEKVLNENPKAVADYKSGKESVIMFLVGQCMRAIGRKVDAGVVKEQLLKLLK